MKRKSDPVIHMESVTKKYYVGEPNELQILFDIGLDIYEGEFVSIVGASGSGKSTLMNIIGLLDRQTDGEYDLNGTSTKTLDDKQLSRIRNKEIGFVFQNFNLIPKISALKNVEMPMMYAGVSQKKRTERAMELIELVGMSDRYTHDPARLSGGQKQRVAIARAMANDPSIILADEPTGALDTKTGRMVMDLFHKLHEEEGKTIVLITHSPELAAECQRMITISDGRIVGDDYKKEVLL
ncbi:ABC transporter ATP-binding protein [Ruminococcus albus]|uniref:ABC transporter related protein n=1 Tax=Ruminococcus albus (strain ATCC 27210 / DSM 20455 / JCM 14654 / NCDO 2250 / 7) TaxID=697329 RepID=E6UL15_RUMA7|nr:ABC transporter ATP-binding protein [Ruminococcus albus]ADU24361.1 ABC transporter related protein [Ruminococcus albus 7 = DSM 20455]